jgi:disulfide bond formation protein DsbB
VLAAVMATPMLATGGWVLRREFRGLSERREVLAARWSAHERLAAAPAAPTLPVEVAAHGRDLFLMTCASCHNAAGTGIEGLGRDLTRSWFVAALTDADMLDFLRQGRPNARPAPMPARGGNEALTDGDLAAVVTYLRGLQDPRRLPELPAARVLVADASENEKAAALEAAGGDAELAEWIAHGTKLFAATCASCHGADARGLPDKGKDLTQSVFTKGLDDDALLEFLKRGRDPGDPSNTTGVAMPPKGGNPALSEDDLLDVIAYLRSLQSAGEQK